MCKGSGEVKVAVNATLVIRHFELPNRKMACGAKLIRRHFTRIIENVTCPECREKLKEL